MVSPKMVTTARRTIQAIQNTVLKKGTDFREVGNFPLDGAGSLRPPRGETRTLSQRTSLRDAGRGGRSFEELNPTNYLFKKLLSYRTYRLRNPRTYLSSSRRTAVQNIRRDIPPKVKRDNTSSGEDGVLVLDFLAKLVQEFDRQEMNEGQAIRLLPEFLSGMALRQYTYVSQTAGSHHRKVSVWPEAVQWLLRSFATDEAIRQAVLALP